MMGNGMKPTSQAFRTGASGLLAGIGLLLFSSPATAEPVVYTLRTVSDGKIGNHHFKEALVTITLRGNTDTVEQTSSAQVSGALVYTNRIGRATVTVDDNGDVTTAAFAPGEVWVRYDTGIGVAGFASEISPNYPFALNCINSPYPSAAAYAKDCTQGSLVAANGWGPDGTSGSLAVLSSPGNYLASTETTALPQSLAESTLLSGTAHACADVYTIAPVAYGFLAGFLLVCKSDAPRGLKTDHGDLYFKDAQGGSAQQSPDFPGWDVANTGTLNVEILPRSE